jgi:hypothetical protein
LAEFAEGRSELTADLAVYHNEAETPALCLIERVRVSALLLVESSGADTAVISRTIELLDG